MKSNNKNFTNSLEKLEHRALQIQLEYFKIPPEKRGRLFYSLEFVGEMGELLNDCKKFIRTNLTHRKEEQVNKKIPEETADTLIALMLIKLAAHNNEKIYLNPIPKISEKDKTLIRLHTCLSSLALSASSLYVKEVLTIGSKENVFQNFDINLYKSVIESLLSVANFFDFDLEVVTNQKLNKIITKVKNGHYD